MRKNGNVRKMGRNVLSAVCRAQLHKLINLTVLGFLQRNYSSGLPLEDPEYHQNDDVFFPNL
jgi:hypothetical protein